MVTLQAMIIGSEGYGACRALLVEERIMDFP
jgi:hypothetical protein